MMTSPRRCPGGRCRQARPARPSFLDHAVDGDASAPSRADISSGAAWILDLGRGIRPVRTNSGTIRLTVSTGTAKPMPADEPDSEMIAVLTSIRRPAESSRGPPELPGLIAALAWITPAIPAAGAGRERSVQRADDPGGERMAEAEGIADREHRLTDPEIGRGTDRDRRQPVGGFEMRSTARS